MQVGFLTQVYTDKRHKWRPSLWPVSKHTLQELPATTVMLSENTANREKGTWTKIYHNGESEFPTMLEVKHVQRAGVWLPD